MKQGGGLINIVSRNSPNGQHKSLGPIRDGGHTQTLQHEFVNQSSSTFIEEPGKRQSSFIPSANVLDYSINQSTDLKGGAAVHVPQQKVSIMQHTYNNKVPLQKSLKAKKT